MSLRRQAVAVEEGGGGTKRDPRGIVPQKAAVSRDDDKQRKRREAEARQKRTAKLGPLEKLVAQLEERISVLEAEQKTRSAELSDPSVYDDASRRNKLLSDYQTGADKLEELTARWEKSMAELETARAAFEAEAGSPAPHLDGS
jgi:ATP-binding cassette subfamily F protein 3